ncbi:MAG: hypothetical protein JRI97_08355 [Deltaproteobacteria bacterium]|nr:hypothetical protein [Deltaproteobacteria bacterium]
MRRIVILLAVFAAVAGLATEADCRTKLTALPQREAAVLWMDNPRGVLVAEERVLTLQKGENQVDFSWNGVTVDPDSIRLSLDAPEAAARLLALSYPPGENALVWEIWAAEAMSVRARIHYLLSNIDSMVEYRALVAPDETSLAMNAYLVVRNFSGEDFHAATIRPGRVKPFTSSVASGETLKNLIFSKNAVPVEKVWTFDAAALPWDPESVSGNVGIPVSYELVNTAAGGLGKFALWDGKVRVFTHPGGNGQSMFLGEDRLDMVPLGGKGRISIGDSRDVVVTQRQLKNERTNVRRNKAGWVILYDTDEILAATVENFKETPVTLAMIQHIDGEWKMLQASHKYEKTDAYTLKFILTIPAKDKLQWRMHYKRLNVRG